eukprot:scaffold80749_cov36-Cyclotella_meneghiniana.AAC.1
MPIGLIAFVVHRDLSFGLPLRFMASLAQCLIRSLMKLVVTLSSFVAYQAFRYPIIVRCLSGFLLSLYRSLPIRLFVIAIVEFVALRRIIAFIVISSFVSARLHIRS